MNSFREKVHTELLAVSGLKASSVKQLQGDHKQLDDLLLTIALRCWDNDQKDEQLFFRMAYDGLSWGAIASVANHRSAQEQTPEEIERLVYDYIPPMIAKAKAMSSPTGIEELVSILIDPKHE